MKSWAMSPIVLGLLVCGCGNPFSRDTDSPILGVWQAQEIIYLPTALNSLAFIQKGEYYENNADGRLIQVGMYQVLRVADTTRAGVRMKSHTVNIDYFSQESIQLLVGTTGNPLEMEVLQNSSLGNETVRPLGPRLGLYHRLHSGEGF